MPAPLSLAETEHFLWRLITAPEGVAAALRDDAAAARDLEATIAGDARLSAQERLGVYADMYFFRLLDSLKEDYPYVLAVVGDAEFHNLITDYLLAHPPAHPSLRYAGQHLAVALTTHRVTQRWPFLSDLARFEWALLDAFDAADAPALEAARLEHIAPEEWATLRFDAAPSVRVVDSAWDLRDLRERIDRRESVEVATAAATSTLVWRQDLKVFHRTIAPLERACVDLLLRGEPFGAWCELAAERVGADAAAPEVVGLLRRWLSDGLLAAIAPHEAS